ncbi:MAG: hypothetical protein E6J88_12650 [Deltaproteobacteria bacterium]|nr:MAG: hypothetical protein E6J88_12650 [Deltaproteobacteria bacterium]
MRGAICRIMSLAMANAGTFFGLGRSAGFGSIEPPPPVPPTAPPSTPPTTPPATPPSTPPSTVPSSSSSSGGSSFGGGATVFGISRTGFGTSTLASSFRCGVGVRFFAAAAGGGGGGAPFPLPGPMNATSTSLRAASFTLNDARARKAATSSACNPTETMVYPGRSRPRPLSTCSNIRSVPAPWRRSD